MNKIQSSLRAADPSPAAAPAAALTPAQLAYADFKSAAPDSPEQKTAFAKMTGLARAAGNRLRNRK
jgi:hypothetical protein